MPKPDPMTLDRFEQCAKKTKIRSELLEAAKLVLVEGQGINETANASGLLRQELDRAMRRLDQLNKKLSPIGWRSVTVVLPDALASEVEEMEKRENAKYRTNTSD